MAYIKTNWQTGDTVTAVKMNNIEDGIYANDTAVTNLKNSTAPTFATNVAYSKGDYVFYNGVLYEFTANHAAGVWTGTDVTPADLAGDVSSLKSDFDDLQDAVEKNYFLAEPVATWTGTFTAKQEINTYVILSPNVEYTIVNRTQLTGDVLCYGLGEDTNYKKLTAWQNTIVLTVHGTERYLKIYNRQSNLDTVKLEIYETGNGLKVNNLPEIYYVNNKEPELGEYTSLTQCLLDLKDNENEKIIYIDGDDYDIFQEYIDANVPVYTGNSPASDFYDYCVWVPKNTHIIGRGLVRLKWMPSVSSSITYNQARTVSPLNIAGSCTIENIEIYCKNGRYCIHDDPQKPGVYKSNDFTGAIKKFKNVKCYKYASDTKDGQYLGSSSTIGFGAHKEMHYEYENCYFGNTANGDAFYGHTENQVNGANILENMSSDFTLNNCIFDSNANESVLLHNVTRDTIHCRILFSNCHFSGKISVKDASESSPHRPNAWDITLLRCNTVTVEIDDTNNRYPVKVFD